MNIQDAFFNALSALWTKLAAFLPNFVASLAILFIGYLIARVVAGLARGIVVKLGIDTAGEDAGVQGMLKASGVATKPSEVIARTIFLFLMLIFVVTAADSVGLDAISSTVDTFILFLPKVLAALLIALLGLYFAQIAREAVERMTASLDVEYASALVKSAYGLLVVVVLMLAVNQLEIETGLLQMIIAIVLSVAGLSAAIALGFGTRRVAQNIVNGIYARDALDPGVRIIRKETEGSVVEVGSVTTIIESDDGRRHHIPNSDLMNAEFIVEKRPQAHDSGA